MIAVFGESYAENMKGGWANRINTFHHSKNYAVCGSSTPTAYKKFLKALDEPKLESVVFTYTAQYRIPILPDHYDGYQWLLKGVQDPEDKDMMKLAETYADYFYDEDIHQVLCNAILKNVNDICEQRGLNLINIIPFDHADDIEYDYSLAKFPILRGLDRLSRRESGNEQLYYKRVLHRCERPNHLNEKNNILVYDWIMENIGNSDQLLVDVNDTPDIDLSAESWSKWFPEIPHKLIWK